MEYLPLMLILIRGTVFAGVLLSITLWKKGEHVSWDGVAVLLILGFGTNFANVVLAQWPDSYNTHLGVWDIFATTSFQGAVLLGCRKNMLVPPRYALLVAVVAVVAFSSSYFVGGDNLIVIRAVLLFNSLTAMSYCSYKVAQRAFGDTGVVVVFFIGALLLWWGFAGNLISNNLLGL